jgi:S-adenosylmethionine synthetase
MTTTKVLLSGTKVTLTQLREDVMEKVVKAVIPEQYLDDQTIFHINPCGNFIIGGPMVS